MIATLLSDVVSVLLLAGPAWITARLLGPERSTALEAVSDALLLAVTLVGIPVFTVAMLTRSYLGVTWMTTGALVALGVSAGVLWWRFRGGWRERLTRLAPAARGDRLALWVGLAVFVVFLVNYDRRHFQYGCINGVVMQALTPEAANAFDPHGNQDEDAIESEDWGRPTARDPASAMNLLDVHGTGQRLGTTAVIAPMVAMFDTFGFRLTYALLPVICLLFGFRLVRRLTGRARLAVLAAALAVLNPYVLKIVILDENVMAYCFATASLALLIEGRRYALAGLAFGAALGIRHIDLPLGLAALILIGWRPRAIAAFAVAGLVFVLPCALHHHFTYGSVFQHEHFVDEVFVSVPHEFLGARFDYTGLLNWPFYDHYVRTPYNPYPTAFYYPINVVAHLGTLLSALALTGAAVLAWRHRRLALALLAWLIPQYALLAVLENWMDPNKMGIIITLFPALLIALGVGLAWLTGWRQVAVVAGLTVALSLGIRAAGGWHFPDDPRFYAKYPRVRAERPEYYAFERDVVTTGSPLPSTYLLQQYTLFRPLDRLRHLAEDWSDRRFRRPGPEIAPFDGEGVTVTLDLSAPLMGRDFATLGAAGHPVDATPATAQVQVDGLTGWEPTPMSALVARNRTDEVAVYLRFGEDGFADVSSDRVYSIEQRERPHLRQVSRPGSFLTLTIRPGDRLHVLETVSLDEVLVYVWEITLEDGALHITTPRKMFHN